MVCWLMLCVDVNVFVYVYWVDLWEYVDYWGLFEWLVNDDELLGLLDSVFVGFIWVVINCCVFIELMSL